MQLNEASMMRSMVLFFALCLLASCMDAARPKHVWPGTDVGKYRLFGKVRSIEETQYSIDEKGQKEGALGSHITRFDTAGRMVSAVFGSIMGEGGDSTLLFYNSDGKMVREKRYREGDTLINSFTADGKHSKAFEYKEGVLVKRNVGAGDGVLFSTDSSFDAHDSLLETSVSRFDSSGDLLTDSVFDGRHALTTVTTNRYDGDNNELENDYYSVVRGTHMISKMKYDREGLMTEQKNYFKNRQADAYKYKYTKTDKYGNWLVQENYEGGKLAYVMERVIEYWDPSQPPPRGGDVTQDKRAPGGPK